MKPVNVLFLAPDPLPVDAGRRLMLDADVREIREKVRAADYRDAIRFDVHWALRTRDLLQALVKTQPQVVHYSGHGSPGLMLVDAGGSPRFLEADALRQLFQVLASPVRLVVMSACYYEEQAAAIAESVGCVVGTPPTISDEAARTFDSSFYRAIAFGHSVRVAFEQAVVALRLEYPFEQDFPRLIATGGVDPARLVLIQPDADADPAAPRTTRPDSAPPAPDTSRQIDIDPSVFRVPSAPRDPELVSVMMPFAPEFNGTFQEIRNACRAVGLRCERADTIWEETTFIQEVFNLIYRSAAIVVDLSGRNPNVMYECGIAHTLGRPVVLISRSMEALPVDLAHYRILPYEPDAAGHARMREWLIHRLGALTGNG